MGGDDLQPSQKRTRVLLAEDEFIIRLDLRETLEEEGYAVVGETGRGDEVIPLARELKPDIAILDIKMPGLDGLSAARGIVQERLAAVMILTAFSQRDLIERARDSGALAYLVKPFQKAELVPALQVVLARSRQIQQLHEEAQDLEAQLEARRLVDSACEKLGREQSLSTSAALSQIQQRAMRERVTMRSVAEAILHE